VIFDEKNAEGRGGSHPERLLRLIDADYTYANEVLAKHYGLPIGPGLSELLSGTVAVHEAIRSIPIATI